MVSRVGWVGDEDVMCGHCPCCDVRIEVALLCRRGREAAGRASNARAWSLGGREAAGVAGRQQEGN